MVYKYYFLVLLAVIYCIYIYFHFIFHLFQTIRNVIGLHQVGYLRHLNAKLLEPTRLIAVFNEVAVFPDVITTKQCWIYDRVSTYKRCCWLLRPEGSKLSRTWTRNPVGVERDVQTTSLVTAATIYHSSCLWLIMFLSDVTFACNLMINARV